LALLERIEDDRLVSYRTLSAQTLYLGKQMRKRKSPTTSKKPGSRKMAAIAKQAIAKSPKNGPVALARHSSALTPLKRKLSAVEIPETRFQDSPKLLGDESTRSSQVQEGLTSATTHPNHLKQESPVEISEPLQNDGKLSEKDNKESDVFSATTNMQAYQAKLLEILSANIHFSFEYAQRLATAGSPVEVLTVNSEFISRRIAMFLRHSKQIAELVLRRSRFG
jgi:hypothetical protein